jgi:hypothetical protein
MTPLTHTTRKSGKILTAVAETTADKTQISEIETSIRSVEQAASDAERSIPIIKQRIGSARAAKMMGKKMKIDVDDLRRRIQELECVKTEAPFLIDALAAEKRDPGARIHKNSITLNNLGRYEAAKRNIEAEEYFGSASCIRARKTLETFAPSLNMTEDLADFYRWLRWNRPKSFFPVGDSHGLVEVLK